MAHKKEEANVYSQHYFPTILDFAEDYLFLN